MPAVLQDLEHAGVLSLALLLLLLRSPCQLLSRVGQELAINGPAVLQDLKHAGDAVLGADGSRIDAAIGGHVRRNITCARKRQDGDKRRQHLSDLSIASSTARLAMA